MKKETKLTADEEYVKNEKLKQIDQMIAEINAMKADAIARSKTRAGVLKHKSAWQEVERYEFMLMHLRVDRANLLGGE